MRLKELLDIYYYMTSDTYRDLTLLKEVKKMNENLSNTETIMHNNDELEPITYNYNQNKKFI